MFEVIQDFKASINGHITHSQPLFNTTSYIYDRLLDMYGDERYDLGLLIIDLMYTIERQYFNSDVSYPEIESELCNCIERTYKFENLKFEVFSFDYHFLDINKDIQTGKYTKE